jgi:hypothetical protein
MATKVVLDRYCHYAYKNFASRLPSGPTATSAKRFAASLRCRDQVGQGKE